MPEEKVIEEITVQETEVSTPCEKCRFKKAGHYITGFGNPCTGVLILDGSPDIPTYEYGNYIKDSVASNYLNKILKLFGLNEDNYYRTYSLKCGYVTKTGNYSPPTKKELDACKPTLKEELDLSEPKFILLLGKIAVKQVFGNLTLEKIRGNPINRDGIVYVATYSPEELTEKHADLKELPKKCVHFANDIKKFIGLSNGTVKQAEFDYEIITCEEDFIKMAKRAKETGVCSVDIETNRLEPFFPNSEILSIAFTPAENESYVVLLSWPTGKYFELWNYKPQMNIHLAILLIKAFMKDASIKKIFHRAQFDVMWLQEVLGAIVNNVGDTLVMLSLIDSESSKKLKYCAKKYTKLGDYEYDAKLYTGETNKDFCKIPPEVLARYNAGDTDVTIRIYPIFKKKLEEAGLWDLYENFVLPNMHSLIKLQRDGVAIDLDRCVELRKKYEREMENLYAEMKELEAVINFERITGKPFKPTSATQVMALAYGGTIKTSEEIPREKGAKGAKKFVEAIVTGYEGIEPVKIAKLVKDKATGKSSFEERNSLDKDAMVVLFKEFYKGPEYRSKIETFDIQEFPVVHPLFEFLKPLALYKTYSTQLSNHLIPFIESWAKCNDKRVHASFNVDGARTGRLCISEGTLIEVVRDVSKSPKGIPIEDVREGDLVYSYDANNKLCLKKVKWAGRTGYEKCIKLNWLGQGRHTTGSLILTAGHRVRLTNGNWKMAQDLVSKDRILAMSRTSTSGYSRLHVFGNKEIKDHRFIYEQVNCIKRAHVHHNDENKQNNLPENLRGMTHGDHCALHYSQLSDEEKAKRTSYLVNMDRSKIDYEAHGLKTMLNNLPPKFTLLRMMASCGGRLKITSDTYGYDFNTFKRYLKTYDIDWRTIRHRYGEDKMYLSTGRVNQAISRLKTIPKVSRHLRIGTSCAKRLISANNHTITSVQQDVFHNVYDIEVEDTQLFIANELCVHNSSSAPNLQNIAREGFVKSVFCSRWGDDGFLIELDYKMLELYIWAYFSQDPNFCQALKAGVDIHRKVASEIMFNVPMDQITKAMRTEAKQLAFGLPYGKSARTIAKELEIPVEQAQAAIDGFFAEFPGNKIWMDGQERFAEENGYVATLTGRRRQICFEEDYKKALRRASNSPIQGTASDVTVFAKRKLDTAFIKMPDKAVVCGTVHDSIWVDAKKSCGKEIIEISQYIMENTGFPWITFPLKAEVCYGTSLSNMIEYKSGDTLKF